MRAELRRYRVFGFRLLSELALPELADDDDGADRADDVAGLAVGVRFGEARRPEAATAITDGVVADPRHFWMDVPGVARILVRSGCEMIVEPARGADELAIRAFLLGSAMGALLHQRGLLPLHASAVRMGAGAVAFMGRSGAGKSTIALHLADRGHPLLSDDISALAIGPEAISLHPGPRRVKLWQPSLAATGRDAAGLGRVLPTLDKYQLPLDKGKHVRAAPLAAVVLLDRGSETGIATVPGAAAMGALIANTFRGELVAPMRRGRAHFDQCLAVARHARMLRLTREWSLDHLERTSTAITAWMDATA